MIVTKKYCDLCEKEIKRVYEMNLERPIELYFDANDDQQGPCFGRYTLDGVWEADLCKECMVKISALIQELKK